VLVLAEEPLPRLGDLTVLVLAEEPLPRLGDLTVLVLAEEPFITLGRLDCVSPSRRAFHHAWETRLC